MDVYTETTIKLMQEREFNRYLKLMIESDIPENNKIHLIYLKVKEFEEEAKNIILKAASKRKELQEMERKYNV